MDDVMFDQEVTVLLFQKIARNPYQRTGPSEYRLSFSLETNCVLDFS
jgi:hypothetical protein